jgi:hypothetical protein
MKMITQQTAEKSIELLKAYHEQVLAFERRLNAGDSQAILSRLHNQQLDRFDGRPESIVDCDCSPEFETSKAFSAYPTDTEDILLICVDCGQVWALKDRKAAVRQVKV